MRGEKTKIADELYLAEQILMTPMVRETMKEIPMIEVGKKTMTVWTSHWKASGQLLLLEREVIPDHWKERM